MGHESFIEQPDWAEAGDAVSFDDHELSKNPSGSLGEDTNDEGQVLLGPVDLIEALLAEARDELDRPPAARRRQLEVPTQPVRSRYEADHLHYLMQRAESHPLFNKLPRQKIVQMMLEDETRQREVALDTPDQEYEPSYETDKRRVAAYLEKKTGKRD